jgi:colicin import membrane protein
MKTTTISSLLLAVAVLATGCHKAEPTTTTTTTAETNGMGPAQAAGKAVDDTGAKVAEESRQAADKANAAAERAGDKANAAAERAGDKIDAAAERTGENMRQAGANMREGSKEAAHNVKEGAADATAATGRALERTGEKMQNASK